MWSPRLAASSAPCANPGMNASSAGGLPELRAEQTKSRTRVVQPVGAAGGGLSKQEALGGQQAANAGAAGWDVSDDQLQATRGG